MFYILVQCFRVFSKRFMYPLNIPVYPPAKLYHQRAKREGVRR